MEINIDGVDGILNRYKELEKRINELEGAHDVPLSELFTPEFLQKFTEFKDAGELLVASGLEIDSQEDFENLPTAEWNAFIAKSTPFINWDAMLETAAAEWAKKKLGL